MLKDFKNSDQKFLIKLGNNVRKYRREKKFSQSQLATDCNLDLSIISRIERAIVNTSVGNIYRISIALEVSMEDLLYSAEDKK